MVAISGNSCSIVTIFDMGVECSPTSATTIYTNDGAITLLITGGTSPYTISWDNGMQGNTLDNLSPGTYSATVVDYYGDYTATTSCVVGYSTIILDKLVKCEYSSPTGSTIFVTQINSLTYNAIYSFSGYSGCYQYTGIELYTGQTYSALTTTGVYDDCDTCDPPVPTYTPPDLCLRDIRQGIYIPFGYSGTDTNNMYVWSGASSMSIEYNLPIKQWEVINWTGTGTMIQQSKITIPTGTWTHTGVPYGVWDVVTGVCSAATVQIIIEVTGYPETCQGIGDGNITITPALGGTPPYEYRVQGLSPYPLYQTSGLFTNVTSGTYICEVKDSLGNTGVETTIVSYNGIPTTYYLTISQSNLKTNISSTAIDSSYEYDIQVSPSLPIGRQLSFDVTLSRVKTENNNGNVTFNNSFTIIKNTVQQADTTSAPSTTAIPFCSIYTTTTTTDTISNTTTLTMIGGDTINGDVVQGISLSNITEDCNCKTAGTYQTTLSIDNISMVGGAGCELVSQNVNSIIETINKEECI